MKKIAFCINSLTQGGAEKIVLTLIANLSNKYSIELICLEKTTKFEVPKNLKIAYLSKKTGLEGATIKFLLLFLLAYRLKKYCQVHEISLVQSHIFRANYINVLAKMLGSKHEVQIVTHGLIRGYYDKNLAGKINLILIQKLYPYADTLIANSEGNKNDIIRILGNKGNIHVINNPFPIDDIQMDSFKPINSKKIVFENHKRYLISVGRLTKTKRQSDIINAFSKVADTHPLTELIFIGEGEELQPLLNLSQMLNLRERIYFLGHTDNPYKYIRKSQIFISASELESFGNVLVEAMACSCPIISYDCPVGPAEILVKSEEYSNKNNMKFIYAQYGILVPVGDIDCMAETINILLSDGKMRKDYIVKGLKRSMSFDIRKIIPLYEEVLA